jgi:hypothetical protein
MYSLLVHWLPVLLAGAASLVRFLSLLTTCHLLQSLSTPQNCLHRHDPQGSYKADTLTAFFRTVDAMASFPNTLGTLVADQLINDTHSESCAPVVVAVIRDLKTYMNLKLRATGQRVLPIGFGGAEYKQNPKVLDYLSTQEEGSCADFWTVSALRVSRSEICK